MNVLDLFSGIGGFSLGLERAGMRTVAFCEINPFARRVLAKHWPSIPCYDDVRTINADRLRSDGIAVDGICGGFPCQDISVAGKNAGIEGERSGLWKEYARIIGELRPRFVIVENVAALLNRGLDVVLADLAEVGYDAEWHCIPASAIGAPHRRDRIWIVAYPAGDGWGEGEPFSDAWCDPPRRKRTWQSGGIRSDVADADRRNEHGGSRALQMGWGRLARKTTQDGDAGRTQWGFEPDVGRVAHGVSDRVDRLCGLGNAVVPQIPEIIGRAIMTALSQHERKAQP
jgi:DNA (cytosine-5)-methyltransferase 1